ncbi:hypothetical protein BDR26DRAFT_1005569 [Obelidium mucronatum]|nr:hypothetical protein BDR26DRAFT_1005569 [Obelidium mucronatum]
MKREAAADARDRAALRRARRADMLRHSDPRARLRISGVGVGAGVAQPAAPEPLLAWPGDGRTRIDRFDARNALAYLSAADEGAEINLDPSDTSPQLLVSTNPSGDCEEDCINFERYRDVIECEIGGKIPEKVIQYIDTFWNELYLANPPLASTSASSLASSSSKDDSAPSKSLQDIVSELTADECLMDLIVRQQLHPTHIESLNSFGKAQYSISNVFSQYKNEIDELLGVKSGSNKQRKRSERRTRLSQKQRASSSSSDDSSDSSSTSETEHKSEFILEFSMQSDQDDQPAIPKALDHPIQLKTTTIEDKSSKYATIEKAANPAPKSETASKPLTASERLKMKAKLALNKQVIADEKMQVQFKKRKIASGGSSTIQRRQRSQSPEIDEFGRIKR